MRATEPETASQCLAKLRRLVSDLAALDRLADQVKSGGVYLFFLDNRFFPIEKGKAETFLTTEDLSLENLNGLDDVVGIERDLVAETARNLRRLENVIDDGHNLVQAREKKCNDLKAASSGAGASSTPTTETSASTLKIELAGKSETIDLATAVRSPPFGSPETAVHLKSGSPYTVTVTLTGSLPAGYTVYVIYHGVILKDLGPDPSGDEVSIEEAAGFGAGNDVEAAACVKGGKPGQAGPSNCVAPEVVISIFWQP